MAHTDTMSVLLNATIVRRRHVVVDNVHNIVDIKTTSRNTSGNQDRSLAGTKSTNGILTLLLSTVAMNRSTWDIGIKEEIVELIGRTLAIDEDDGTSRWGRHEQIEESSTLGMGFDEDHILLDVDVTATSTANSNADMIVSKMLLGEVTSNLGESSREHEVGDVTLLLVY
jgi:hypothetical protein